jgi:hypothetical protein
MASIEMREKLEKLQEAFSNDEKAQELVSQLRARYEELQTQVFSPEDYESEEFEVMNEEYYSMVKEGDVDDMLMFDFLWFA